MRSLADDLRERTRARVLAMSVAERIALALALGDDDLARYARVNRVERAAALHFLRNRRQRGRVPSEAARRPPS